MTKGYAGQLKNIQNHTTIAPLGSGKHGLDVLPKALAELSAVPVTPVSSGLVTVLDEVGLTKDQQRIEITGHAMKEGDVLRFITGPLVNIESTVIDVIDANNLILGNVIADATTSTCLRLRPVTLTIDLLTGALVVAQGPVQIVLDGVDTEIEEDTVTPANNKSFPTRVFVDIDGVQTPVLIDTATPANNITAPSGMYFDRDGVQTQVLKDTGTPANTRAMPVELVSTSGIEATFNVTTGDLNVDTTHLGANADSMRIGDGTNLMGINASLEALVHDTDALAELVLIDAKLPATLGSKADAASLAITQSTEDKAVLASIDAKSHENAIDANNSTVATLGIGATYTGTATDVTHFASVSIQLFADEDSAADGMQFQFSTDNVNWDEVNKFNLETATSSTRRFQFPVTAQYFRVVYINGGTAQTAFRVQTILHTTEILTSIHRIDAELTNDRSVLVTKSVIAGETSAGGGGFVNVKVNSNGAIEANCIGPEVKDFLDGGVVDSSGTPILVAGTSVVASLASSCQEIEVVDDIGEYMSIRDGAGVVLAYLPLGGGRVKVSVASGTNIKLYSEIGSTINVGSIAINFLG